MSFRFSAFVALSFFSILLAGCKHIEQSLVINSNNGKLNLQVEVVSTSEERRQGLMGRKVLADNTGMLFDFGSGSKPTMWMKDMLISLDMVFIGEDHKINYIEEDVPPCVTSDDSRCLQYHSDSEVEYVLELPAGYTKKNKIEVGNLVELLGLDSL